MKKINHLAAHYYADDKHLRKEDPFRPESELRRTQKSAFDQPDEFFHQDNGEKFEKYQQKMNAKNLSYFKNKYDTKF